jgi:hypothetical protein
VFVVWPCSFELIVEALDRVCSILAVSWQSMRVDLSRTMSTALLRCRGTKDSTSGIHAEGGPRGGEICELGVEHGARRRNGRCDAVGVGTESKTIARGDAAGAC